MTDLRAVLIEAVEPFVCHSAHAPQALDAVLGVLADRADEWFEAGIPEWDNAKAYQSMKRVTVKHTVHPLIAVLRGDTE